MHQSFVDPSAVETLAAVFVGEGEQAGIDAQTAATKTMSAREKAKFFYLVGERVAELRACEAKLRNDNPQIPVREVAPSDVPDLHGVPATRKSSSLGAVSHKLYQGLKDRFIETIATLVVLAVGLFIACLAIGGILLVLAVVPFFVIVIVLFIILLIG